MAKEGLVKIIQAVAYAKLGLATAVFSFYMGAKSHELISRIEDTFLYRNVPVAKSSFQDPAGLEIETEINEKGEKQAYLVHRESGKKIAIGYDMLPQSAEDLARGLEDRLYSSGKPFK